MVRDYGHTAVGLYEMLMTDTEVMTVWATDPEGHEALGRAIDDERDERIARWRSTERQYLTRWREELMTRIPAPSSRAATRCRRGPPGRI